MTRNIKICPICDKPFPCPPSDKTVTCGKACSRVHRSNVHKGVSNVWSQESRKKLSDLGITDNLKKGTPSASASPKAGHYATNVSAKDWHIVSPEGRHYKFRNLNLWAENNYTLFGFDAPSDARKVAAGIKLIKRAAHGKPVGSYTYKGWLYVID